MRDIAVAATSKERRGSHERKLGDASQKKKKTWTHKKHYLIPIEGWIR